MDFACTPGLYMAVNIRRPLALVASLDEADVVDEGDEGTCLVTGGAAAGRRWNCADTPAIARSFVAFVTPALAIYQHMYVCIWYCLSQLRRPPTPVIARKRVRACRALPPRARAR